jgi:hypothetical protein
MTAMPRIVSAEEWQQARDGLLKAEKEATRALDALAARRRPRSSRRAARPADESEPGAVRCDPFPLSHRIRPGCQGAMAGFRHDKDPKSG